MVDDECDIITVISKALTGNGFEVNAYINPVTALSEFQPGYYDIALIDIRMPGMNGFELYRELRKQDDKIEICFLTAFEITPNEFEKVMPSCDVRSFIKKPFHIHQLLATIGMLTDMRWGTSDFPAADKPKTGSMAHS